MRLSRLEFGRNPARKPDCRPKGVGGFCVWFSYRVACIETSSARLECFWHCSLCGQGVSSIGWLVTVGLQTVWLFVALRYRQPVMLHSFPGCSSRPDTGETPSDLLVTRAFSGVVPGIARTRACPGPGYRVAVTLGSRGCMAQVGQPSLALGPGPASAAALPFTSVAVRGDLGPQQVYGISRSGKPPPSSPTPPNLTSDRRFRFAGPKAAPRSTCRPIGLVSLCRWH